MSAKTANYQRRPQSPGYCMDISGRLHAISTENMSQILTEVKNEQAKNVVVDTLAALVTDVNATTEVLRRSLKHGRADREPEIIQRKKDTSLRSAPPARPAEPEVEYKLRLSSPLNTQRPSSALPFPTSKRRTPVDERASVERVCQEFGIPTPTPEDNLRKRARSETPSSRRIIQIETSPPPAEGPFCAGCGHPIVGPCITALAPNSVQAQKFHPEHFVCAYCQKALNLKGTYKEHQRKPYCHDCFYKLYSGHIYVAETRK